MNIEIIDGWSFKVDEHQYILVHTFQAEKKDFKTRKGTGEMVEKTEEVGYFQTVGGMLKRLAQILTKEKAADGQLQTIRDYIDEMERTVDILTKCVKGH